MKYFVLSTQRSGSDLLRHSLIHLFGENSDGPDEWIMHPTTRKNLGLPDNLSKAKELVLNNPQLLVDRMAFNSHRKVMYNHILDPDKLAKTIPIIHLIRKDVWAQAKSLWIMKQKIIPPHVDEEKYKQLSYKNIKLHLNHIEIRNLSKTMLNEKQYWYQALANRPNTLTLYYEDDLCDINTFMNSTLPRIEIFLNKKRVVEDYKFKFKKTSSLYMIENTEQFDEQKYSKYFYFDPNKSYKTKYLIRRMKILLKRFILWL